MFRCVLLARSARFSRRAHEMGFDAERRLSKDGALHRALLDRSHQGVSILLRKICGELDIEIDALEITVGVVANALDETDIERGQSAFLAKSLNEDSRACADRGEEEIERRRRRVLSSIVDGLIRMDDVLSNPSIDSAPSG